MFNFTGHPTFYQDVEVILNSEAVAISQKDFISALYISHNPVLDTSMDHKVADIENLIGECLLRLRPKIKIVLIPGHMQNNFVGPTV